MATDQKQDPQSELDGLCEPWELTLDAWELLYKTEPGIGYAGAYWLFEQHVKELQERFAKLKKPEPEWVKELDDATKQRGT